MLPDKVTSCEVKHLFAFDGSIEFPVEVFQSALVAKQSGTRASLLLPIDANTHFILQDEFQKFEMAQAVGLCLLQPDLQAGSQP